MPFGPQLIGPLRQDARLLAVARALERGFAADADLARPRPDVAALRAPDPALKSIVAHPPQASVQPGPAAATAV